ncbi:MAG: hypothetical protein J6Y82_00095 [Bacteroidales bacterium]|nr:hypothetical protein [Bacteroidales bacterium]
MSKNKIARLFAVRRIVNKYVIASQEELLNKLQQEGFKATQATLSRDIKELKIAKVPNPETGYQYVNPEALENATFKNFDPSVVGGTGIRSLAYSGSLAVIKTQPGYASVAASLVDSNHVGDIIGTLAGDDTVLLVIREGVDREFITNRLAVIFPDIRNLLL